jgi:DNA transformation protein and related proteins
MAKSTRRSASRRPAPMRVSEGFKALVLDNLTELGDVIPRSMFGGVGLYCDDVFFGIIAADVMYLKVDAGNRSDFERAGMQPFKPYPDRAGTMQYYGVPLEVVESAPELVEWSRGAVAAAERARKASAEPRAVKRKAGRD